LLRILPPSRATNIYAAESKSDIYFLQHENLLREKMVIRATNNLNLQQQHCCATSCTKMLPVLLGFSIEKKKPKQKQKLNSCYSIIFMGVSVKKILNFHAIFLR